MESKDEALKMAIQALANMVSVFTPNSDWRGVEINDDARKAIVICKQALKKSSWQGLSDKEVDNLMPEYRQMFSLYYLCRAVEQALKEKNG